MTYIINFVINFKIYFRSTSKAMADRKKEGKTEIEKIECLENGKSLLDEIQTFYKK